VIPVVTTEEMRAIDRDAPEPTEVLIERAGAAVARVALRMMDGAYGRRVVVVAGKGNNGADGRAAARRLARRGVRVLHVDAAAVPERLPPSDLVIDAAYGTGFHGDYVAPDPNGARVLAVDIPSGVNGDTGAAAPTAAWADETVTFAALKPGLLLGEGPDRAGLVEVADIGLDVSRTRTHVIEDADAAEMLPPRPRDAHKWQRAVYVVAGSGGMLGAAHLTSTAALRAGAGMVRLATPGAPSEAYPPGEVVGRALPDDWARAVVEEAERFGAVAIGPGLGTSPDTVQSVCDVVRRTPVPIVVDADGLNSLARVGAGARDELLRSRTVPTVLTPHAGEFARLAGGPPGDDRLHAVRALAARTGAVVLLKGSTTVVADLSGAVRISVAGSARLATAGTGDVLTGVIAAFLAAGVAPLDAAALGAHVHGRAAATGHRVGMVAGDLLDLVAAWLTAHGAR
jgi:NAD(P)H-hydrate epimerase